MKLTKWVSRQREIQKIQQQKQESTLQLLIRGARLVNERALAMAEARGGEFRGLRKSHLALFPHIDFDGTRITELAERLDISKQAVSQLVDELAAAGLLSREADPADGRAKLVRFTPLGLRRIQEGLSLLNSVEDELAGVLGRREMRALRAPLRALIQALSGESG